MALPQLILNKIRNKDAKKEDLIELVRLFAFFKDRLNSNEELVVKEFIRIGARNISLDMEILQERYNYYRGLYV